MGLIYGEEEQEMNSTSWSFPYVFFWASSFRLGLFCSYWFVAWMGIKEVFLVHKFYDLNLGELWTFEKEMSTKTRDSSKVGSLHKLPKIVRFNGDKLGFWNAEIFWRPQTQHILSLFRTHVPHLEIKIVWWLGSLGAEKNDFLDTWLPVWVGRFGSDFRWWYSWSTCGWSIC